MRVFNRLPSLSKRAAALIIGVSVAAATALPRQASAESAFKNLAKLNAVYVADPAAAWFERWAVANLKTHDWLNRPDIKIKAGGDLVAAVAADPSGIGRSSDCGGLDRRFNMCSPIGEHGAHGGELRRFRSKQ
jgi:hypothetical protein